MLVTVDTYHFPPYPEMVRNLFKKELPGNQAPLLHAAIGIAGEGSELKEVYSRQNFIEECGDLEFYMEAAHIVLADQGRPYVLREGHDHHIFTLGNWADIVQSAGGKVIDFTKKAWVYGNRDPNFEGVYMVLTDLREALDFAYELHGTTQFEVRFQNQLKLIGKDGRYKSGTYSDAEALARNDKVASGEEPAKGEFFEQHGRHKNREAQELRASDVGSVEDILGSTKREE